MPFPIDPHAMSEREDIAFCGIEIIWNAVIDVTQKFLELKDFEPTLDFVYNPHRTPLSERKQDGARPDSVSVLRKSVLPDIPDLMLPQLDSKAIVPNAAVPWEFKKHHSTHSNDPKVLDDCREVRPFFYAISFV